MKKLVLLPLLFFTTLLSAQEKKFDYNEQINKLKKYIFTSPDSTRAIANYILSQKNLHDTIKGNAYNIYAIFYGNIEKQDSALYYYKKAITTLEDYPRVQTKPLMNISIIYRSRGEYDESFKYLNKALAINKKLKLRIPEAVVYSNMSSNYQFMMQYQKAVDYALKGIEIAKQEKDTSQLAGLYQKLANTYLNMRNFNFAKDMYQECMALFKVTNDDLNYYYTLINFAECTNHLKEYDEAKKALNEAIAGLQKFKSYEMIGVAHTKLGSIANLQHNQKEALAHYKAGFDALVQANSINTVMIAFEYAAILNRAGRYKEAYNVITTTQNMSIMPYASLQHKMYFEMAAGETYSNLNMDKKAIASLNQALLLKDSLRVVNDDAVTKEVQAKFQTELQREKNLVLEANNKILEQSIKTERSLLWLYIIISVGILITVLLFLRGYRLRAKLNDEKLKTSESEKNLIQQQHLHEQELTNAQREIIEEKQRELTSSALRMANYQNGINEVIERISGDGFKSAAEIRQELVNISRQKDYWKQFETRFNTLHPEFGTALNHKFTNLTKKDIEFCSLLKINLSNKEIASLLQISHESVITKKYRIKKKMEIAEDAEFEKIIDEI